MICTFCSWTLSSVPAAASLPSQLPLPPLCREELLAGRERELARREAALGGAEQRVGQLTRRLEADLKLSATPSAGAASAGSGNQLRGSFDTGFGSALNSASSMRTVTQVGGAAAAATPSRLSGQQQQQPARSSQQAAASSSGTFATPASSLLQRSVTPEPQSQQQYQQQQAPASTTSTAAGGVAQRRDSFASLDGTPDRQASLAQALKQLQGATDKGANRWVGGCLGV